MGAKPLDLRIKKSASPARKPPTPAREPREPREPKRPAPLRVRKRRRRALYAGLALVLIGGLFYAAHRISYLPQYTIQAVEVSGTSSLDPAQIQAQVETVLGTGGSFISPRFIFSYDARRIERALKGSSMRIARAKISRAGFFSTTLDVAIGERAPFARWCAGDARCYIIDETGFVFAASASSTETVSEPFVFSGGLASSTDPLGAYVAPAHFPSALAIMRALGQAGFSPVSAAFDSDTDFSLITDTGLKIYASFGAEPPDLVRNLKLVLGSDALKDHLADLEYVDLRFGQRVFYKLKGENAVAQ